jgi:hypothetical protein
MAEIRQQKNFAILFFDKYTFKKKTVSEEKRGEFQPSFDGVN